MINIIFLNYFALFLNLLIQFYCIVNYRCYLNLAGRVIFPKPKRHPSSWSADYMSGRDMKYDLLSIYYTILYIRLFYSFSPHPFPPPLPS